MFLSVVGDKRPVDYLHISQGGIPTNSIIRGIFYLGDLGHLEVVTGRKLGSVDN